MNIIRLSNYAYPHRGGVETSIHETGKVLASRGHSVYIVCYQPSSGGPAYEVIDGVNYCRRPLGSNTGVYLRENFKKLQGKVDLLSYEDFPAFESGIPYSVIKPKRTLYYAHGWEGHCPPSNGIKSIRQALNNVCDYTIHVGDFIRKWYGDIPDFVSYGGHPGLKETNSDIKTFSWIGRLEPDTGFGKVISVMTALKDLGLKFDFEIFGNGSLRKLISENSGFKFHGFIENPIEKAKGTFILCSGYLSMLEALSRYRVPIAFYDNDLKKDYLKPFENFIFMTNTTLDYEAIIKHCLENAGATFKKEKFENFMHKNSWEFTAMIIEDMARGIYEKRIK